MSNQKWRRTADYRHWADDVKSRDNQTCQCCSRHETELDDDDHIHAHHIRHATYFPSLRFVVSNGISLCEDCHSMLHNKVAGGYRKKCEPKHIDRLMALRDHFNAVNPQRKQTNEVQPCSQNE